MYSLKSHKRYAHQNKINCFITIFDTILITKCYMYFQLKIQRIQTVIQINKYADN
jgi:hypothetical protein